MIDFNMLEIIVFSRIKGEFSPRIKAKYKNLTFTTREASKKKTPEFPNIYVYLMPSMEIGETTEGKDFNGGLFTFQIRVTDNVSEDTVREITYEIVRIMKNILGFRIVGTPSYENDEDTQWSNMRFRKAMGSDDRL